MHVWVNGDEIEVAEGLTVAALVAERGLNPNTIVVEHNLEILSKEMWAQSVLTAEDKLEIIAFVGGG